MKKILLKDVVFLAIISAVLLLVSGLAAPIVMTSHQLASHQAVMAFLYGLICTVALRKVPKKGALLIVGLFTGLVLLFMSPVMLLNQVVGALLAEGFACIFERGYESKKGIFWAAGLYSFWTIPITAITNVLMKGRTISEQIGPGWVCIGLILLTLGLGFLGSVVGHKLADELKKAGKL